MICMVPGPGGGAELNPGRTEHRVVSSAVSVRVVADQSPRSRSNKAVYTLIPPRWRRVHFHPDLPARV
jgi:hypothetical protein